MRYEFAPAGATPTAANEFYIYVSHYKASTGTANEAARAGEAQIIRNDSATLPGNARILYVGDYNSTGGSSEAGYQTIIAPGVNQGLDPMNPSGAIGIDWSVDSLMDEKTESAADLRYRDDLQIMTTNVFYGLEGGLALVPGTYHVFGNNGTTPYQGNVSSNNLALTNLAASAPISAATLYRDLTNASDHLPVVADYTIPILTPFQSWQMLYFGSTTNAAAAPAADPDNDGMSNWAEFLAGTNPTNSASVLRLTDIARQGNDLRITWTMGSGKTNVLERATALGGASSFTDAFTVLTVGSITNYLDVGAATSAPARYYRVRLGP
jgi:hypothetical protein